MARHSSRCLLFAFQLRRSGVEVAKWFVCEKTYLEECGRSEDLIRKTTNRSAAPRRFHEEVNRRNRSTKIRPRRIGRIASQISVVSDLRICVIKISNLEKRRGKNFKFYALLYFQDNDSIIKNSTCIPFSKVRNHAYEDFDVIESGI